MIKKIFSHRFVRFCFSGSIASVADILLLYFLVDFLGWWYLFSAAWSFIFGTVIHYLISAGWVWQVESKKFSHYLKFLTVQSLGLAINLLVMYLLVDGLSCYYLIAKVLAILVGLIWNYFGQSRITFR